MVGLLVGACLTAVAILATVYVFKSRCKQEAKKFVISAVEPVFSAGLEQTEQRLAEQAGRRRSYAPRICALAANCICRVHTGRSIV